MIQFDADGEARCLFGNNRTLFAQMPLQIQILNPLAREGWVPFVNVLICLPIPCQVQLNWCCANCAFVCFHVCMHVCVCTYFGMECALFSVVCVCVNKCLSFVFDDRRSCSAILSAQCQDIPCILSHTKTINLFIRDILSQHLWAIDSVLKGTSLTISEKT